MSANNKCLHGKKIVLLVKVGGKKAVGRGGGNKPYQLLR